MKKNNKAVNNKGNEFDLGMIKFEKFSKCAKVYIDLINRTYLQYRIIEEKSLEIEKIIKLYLDHFVDKNKIVMFFSQFHPLISFRLNSVVLTSIEAFSFFLSIVIALLRYLDFFILSSRGLKCYYLKSTSWII